MDGDLHWDDARTVVEAQKRIRELEEENGRLKWEVTDGMQRELNSAYAKGRTYGFDAARTIAQVGGFDFQVDGAQALAEAQRKIDQLERLLRHQTILCDDWRIIAKDLARKADRRWHRHMRDNCRRARRRRIL